MHSYIFSLTALELLRNTVGWRAGTLILMLFNVADIKFIHFVKKNLTYIITLFNYKLVGFGLEHIEETEIILDYVIVD